MQDLLQRFLFGDDFQKNILSVEARDELCVVRELAVAVAVSARQTASGKSARMPAILRYSGRKS